MSVSVVIPVFRNATTLSELCGRVSSAVGDDLTDIVLVDDASPDDSLAVARSLAAADDRIRVIARATNGGQHRALLDGLAVAAGSRLVCMDADLQDPPEALPALLAAGGPDVVVFGGRRGAYQRVGRRITSRAFKLVLARLAKVPTDASTFVVLPRATVDAVLALPGASPFLTGMIAATGVPTISIPVDRRASATPSGYSGVARLRSGLRGLRWAIDARSSADAHNLRQLDHYARRQSTSIQPRPTPYSRRQVDAAVVAAGLQPGERVLDVGCGLGRATAWLKTYGLEVEGLDLSPVLLEGLRRQPGLADVPTHLGDISHPAPELLGAFDAACGFFVLHHLRDLTAALDGMRRTVRPGGRIVLVEPNGLCPLFYGQILVTRGMEFRVDGGLSRMRRGVLARAALDAGLEHPTDATFGLLPPALANRPRSCHAGLRLEQVPGIAPLRAFRILVATRPTE